MSRRDLPLHPDEFRPAIEACQTEEELTAWFDQEAGLSLPSRSRMDVVLEALAECGRHFTPRLVEQLVERGYAVPLARNPHLSGPALEALVSLCLKALEQPFQEHEERPDSACEVFQCLLEQGRLKGDSPQMQRLWTLWRKGVRSEAHQSHLGMALLGDPALSPEELRHLATLDPRLLPRVIHHPAADLSVWRLALESRGSYWLEFAKHPVARTHPEIRPLVREHALQGGQLTLLGALAADYRAEDFVTLFRAVHHQSSWVAAELLRQAPPEALGRLDTEDLRPLLESTRGEERLLAISLLSRVGHAPPADPPAPSRNR